MFSLIKKIVILVLITIAQAGNLLLNSKDCFLLKDKKCGVKKIIVYNDYMTFPYLIVLKI